MNPDNAHAEKVATMDIMGSFSKSTVENKCIPKDM
jgi:hypothetical protein